MPKGFQKGKSGNPNGRPKGAQNAETKQLREKLSKLLDDNYDKFIKELAELEPKDFINTFKDLLEYCTPKLNRTDLTNDGEKFDFSVLDDAELISELRKLNKSISEPESNSE